jgi:hypothetical protein
LGIKKLECPGKALQTVLMRGVFILVAGRNRVAIRVMQTQLGERNFVNDRCFGKLASRYRQQQRLHGQSIDRSCAHQPSPEQSQLRTYLIWSGLHAHRA